ncbi:type 4a pilus biogenesis protein PilO [Uliginosibacterium gangwonense]|uniref:type 4a pilus biogenesis protein PilO n=1 Tax=Uliginosibacterium gangwonense TaxID=392736 RepID=UPI000374EE39|nr:type 4a pilus biogenesis protein PilO [Uliginosibacterium gangwonense]
MKKTAVPGAAGFSFNRLVDDFRQMDPNDPGVWPMAPKVVVLIVLLLVCLLGSWWLSWKDQLDALDARHAEEQKLKDEWLDKKKQAVNLAEYKKQLDEIDHQFGALLKQLPNRSQMEALLVDINQAGRGHGLQFELWKPGQEMVKDFYAELPIAVELTGSYHDFGQFAADIAKLPRIVTLRDLSVSMNKDNGLKMAVTAVTYRYLDEEEVAKQRREKSNKNANKQ